MSLWHVRMREKETHKLWKVQESKAQSRKYRKWAGQWKTGIWDIKYWGKGQKQTYPCLDYCKSNSVEHDIRAIIPYNLHLLCQNSEKIHCCRCIQLTIFCFLRWLYFVCLKDICVPFLQQHISIKSYATLSTSFQFIKFKQIKVTC